MLVIDAAMLARSLDPAALVAALDEAFRGETAAPPRQHHHIPVGAGAGGTLVMMPAWRVGGHIGIKIATVFGDNAARGLPSVQATVMLLDATTGTPVAMVDGTELTLRRTAAASALAARYLARADASRLLMVGTGQLAPHVIAAHASVRPIREVRVWGRDPGKAQRVADRFEPAAFDVTVAERLGDAVGWADVISCATLSAQPLVHGRDLRPGQHLDLIGAFTPAMREADTEAVRRAELYVDTYAGALAESGELVQALEAGAIRRSDIRGDLHELATGTAPVRSGPDAVTLFKSVGTAIEDLAAAELAVRRLLRG
jgi:ornithine cyclodeaminase/alanine dehydrogenase-like protein (mu-crystallin family)